MAYNYEYGGSASVERPGASRRSRASDIQSRDFYHIQSKRTSYDSIPNSAYNNYQNASNKFNRSTSGSRQYSYKLDNIKNKLAERNNPVLSSFKLKSQSRINSAQRNDSSYMKKNIENYGIPPLYEHQSKSKEVQKNQYIEKVLKPENDSLYSKRSSRGSTTYSKSLQNSGDNMMQTSAKEKFTKKHLDVIYEDPYSNNDLDPKQKEILEKYYLQSRRNLRPSQRKIRTPQMTPDNDIKFVDNGDLVKNPRPTKTPPPPLWGEESEVDETAGEPFYDPEVDPARNSRSLHHMDSSRSKRKQYIQQNLIENGIENDQTETIIIRNKRPKGSKLKKKIVYVYDSDSDEEDNVIQNLESKRNNLLPFSKRENLNNKSSNIAYTKPYQDLPSR